MNILFDCRLLLNSVSGIGYYIRNLIEKLVEIDHINKYTVLLNNSLSNEHPFFKLKAGFHKHRLFSEPSHLHPSHPSPRFCRIYPSLWRSQGFQ